MSYFRTRNNLKDDYSGHEEATSGLRKRILTVMKAHVRQSVVLNDSKYSIYPEELAHELQMHLETTNLDEAILKGSYDKIFEAVEIYWDLAEDIEYEIKQKIYYDLRRAFALSGSVYAIGDDGRIFLKITDELAKDLKSMENILNKKESASQTFYKAVGNLLGRKDSSENIVKDIFVAFEDYLRFVTDTKEFGGAISKLQKDGLITKTQEELLKKIYAFRSDAYGSSHAGNSKKPDEIDAIWFLKTVIAQLDLLDNRINNHK